MRDVYNGEGYAYVQTRSTWEISETSPQFHCKPKITLKKA